MVKRRDMHRRAMIAAGVKAAWPVRHESKAARRVLRELLAERKK